MDSDSATEILTGLSLILNKDRSSWPLDSTDAVVWMCASWYNFFFLGGVDFYAPENSNSSGTISHTSCEWQTPHVNTELVGIYWWTDQQRCYPILKGKGIEPETRTPSQWGRCARREDHWLPEVKPLWKPAKTNYRKQVCHLGLVLASVVCTKRPVDLVILACFFPLGSPLPFTKKR